MMKQKKRRTIHDNGLEALLEEKKEDYDLIFVEKQFHGKCNGEADFIGLIFQDGKIFADIYELKTSTHIRNYEKAIKQLNKAYDFYKNEHDILFDDVRCYLVTYINEKLYTAYMLGD